MTFIARVFGSGSARSPRERCCPTCQTSFVRETVLLDALEATGTCSAVCAELQYAAARSVVELAAAA